MKYKLYYVSAKEDPWGIGLSSHCKFIIIYPDSVCNSRMEVFGKFTNNQWMTFPTKEYDDQMEFLKESDSIEELKQYCLDNYFELFL